MSVRISSDGCIVTVATGKDRVNLIAREAVIHINERRTAFDVACSLLAWSFAADDVRLLTLADRFRTLLADLEDIA